MSDPRTTDALIALLQASPNQLARQFAAYSLGFRHDLRAKTALIAALRDPTNSLEVRCYILEALGHLLDHTQGQNDAREAVRETLREEPAEIRFWSAFALANFGTVADIPRLRALAENDRRVVEGWWSVSKEAADAIEHLERRRRKVVNPK